MTLGESILKLTFDPTGTPRQLLGYDSWLVDPPLKFPQVNGRDIIPTPDSPYPLILDTLNSEFSLKFAVINDASETPAEAMETLLGSMVTVPSYGVKPLKIEVQGISGHWLVAFCHVDKHEQWQQPDPRYARIVRAFELSCAGISYVA